MTNAITCPHAPDGIHQVDTSMEEGPNNCFYCGQPMQPIIAAEAIPFPPLNVEHVNVEKIEADRICPGVLAPYEQEYKGRLGFVVPSYLMAEQVMEFLAQTRKGRHRAIHMVHHDIIKCVFLWFGDRDDHLDFKSRFCGMGSPEHAKWANAKAAERDRWAEAKEALRKMTEHYVQLAGCGDCGNWDPEKEKEVIEARAFLARED